MSMQWSAGVAALALTLSTLTACNGSSSGSGGPVSVTNPPTHYTTIPLVTNRDALTAPRHDANLVNPWGLIFANGAAWVANAGSATATVYDAGGIPQPTIVRIPAGKNGRAGPTGIVYNDSTTAFPINPGSPTPNAQVIFATEAGTIAAWSSAAGFGSNAINVYDDDTGKAHYTGLALLDVNGVRYLFAADFRNGKIDTFDTGFNRLTTTGGFIDTSLPAGYAPFGIQAIGTHLIVTYAKQGEIDKSEEEVGPGLGYVNEFDGSGRLVRRLASGGELNAPWGVALAPANFGQYANHLLIGNFGDGHINAHDPATGAFVGTLSSTDGEDLAIPGLWAIAFPNGSGTANGGNGTGGGTGTDGGTGTGGTGTGGTGTGGTGTGGTGTGGTGGNNQTPGIAGFPSGSLYYTAGSNDERDGSFGRIEVTQIVNGNTGGGTGTTGDSGTDTGTDGGTGGTGTGTNTGSGGSTGGGVTPGVNGPNFGTGGNFANGGNIGTGGNTGTTGSGTGAGAGANVGSGGNTPVTNP